MSVCAACGRGNSPEMAAKPKRVRKTIVKPKTEDIPTIIVAPETPIAAFVEQPVPDQTGLTEVVKRGRGRPLGTKDSSKRRPKGSLNKPPTRHGELGRPKGVKDSKPRQRKIILMHSPMPID